MSINIYWYSYHHTEIFDDGLDSHGCKRSVSHIAEIDEGGQYMVHFEFVSPMAGELRLDFCSWDGSAATMACVFEVAEGVNDLTIDFRDYPTPCTDAKIFYQCGKLPGKHIIKNVQVYIETPTTPYNQADICYNYIAKGKVAEVIRNLKKKYRGVVDIPSTVTHEGEEYTVTKIADDAFNDCSNLTSVTIPNSVKSIGNSAFSWCSGLTSVTIPNSVTNIGDGAFSYCSNLTSVTIPNSVTSIGSWAFSSCSGLTSIDIPNSVSSIGYFAFDGCSGLTSVKIPSSVTSLSGFSGCTGLTSIIIPNSVTLIDSHAFPGCIGLTSVTIPNSVTTINSDAFSGCSKLKSVTIGNNVNKISSGAFAKCSALTDVYCLAENVPWTNTDAFNESYIDYATLHVPAASLNNYKNSEPWKNFQNKVALDSGDIPETPKCAKPEISFENGRVKFTCETEGVEYISDVVLADQHKYYDAEIQLSQTYKVSVYATKAGYDNSDVTTREIVITGNGKAIVVGDVDGDGKVNVADHVKLSEIIMNK